MVKSLRYIDINQHDELEIVVDAFSKEVLYENEKWLSDNERAFIKIFSDGFVDFGIELQRDPMHNDKKYTWSSNADFINRCFELLNTSFELATWHVGAREECSRYSCFFGRNMLLTVAYTYASKNKSKLHYGLQKFKKDNCARYDGEEHSNILDLMDEFDLIPIQE